MRSRWMLGAGLAMLMVAGDATVGAAPDAAAVLAAIIDNHRGGSGKATVTLTVVRPDQQSQYVLQVWTDGDTRSLVQVKAPAKDAGQAFLTVDQNLWIYNPRLKRVLRLPPSGRSESFLGSDISYSDLSGRDFERDYTPTISAEDASGVVLDLTPKPAAPTPYGKVTVRAQAGTYAPVETVFYDQRGQAVKRVTFSEYAKVGQRSFPTRSAIEDLLRAGYRTTATYTEYRFGIPVPDACFTQQALERGCE